MSEVVQRVEGKGKEEEEDSQTTTDLPSPGNEEVGNTVSEGKVCFGQSMLCVAGGGRWEQSDSGERVQ